jgi:hypothetical protein
MKTKKIVLWIVFAFTILVLLLTSIVIWIVLKKSSWWFFGSLIFLGLVWIVIGIILLVNKWNAQLPPSTKIDPADAIRKVIMIAKNDDDNADNLEIRKKLILKLGDKRFDPTPILFIGAIGTEKGQKRAFLINLNNPEKEIGDLIDSTEEEIWKYANLLADHPADEPMKEKVTESLKFGFPERVTERTTPISIKDKEEKEKKEAEEKAGI